MRRTLLIVSLAVLLAGCAIASKPKLRPFQRSDFMLVYPHLATLMKSQGDLPPRPECPIGFTVLDTPALNAWVTVRPEPKKPAPPLKALGETKEAPPPDPDPPAPPRCRQFDLIVTSGVLALPRDQLRAVVAHELGHVYLGHVESRHTSKMLRDGAEILVIGVIPYLVLHSASYPFMAAFSPSEEAEADRFAVELLSRSRSSCGALATVLERFQEAHARSVSARFEWLASHPSPDGRVEAVRELCRTWPSGNHRGPKPADNGSDRSSRALADEIPSHADSAGVARIR